MNDFVILGLSLGGFLASISIVLFIWQNRSFEKSAQELKIFQMENTRLIQQMEKNAIRVQDENRKFFKGLTYSVAQIFERVDREERDNRS